MSPPSTVTNAAPITYVDENQYNRHLIQQQQQQRNNSPKENLMNLTQRISNEDLKQAIRVEIKRLVTDYDRLISMLQQRSEILEQEYENLQLTEDSYQRRYEKAVREMQFFKKKYDKAIELNKQYATAVIGGGPRSPSLESSTTSSLAENRALQQQQYGENMLPTSPPPSSISGSSAEGPIYNLPPPPPPPSSLPLPLPNSPLPHTGAEKARHLSRSSSSSTTSSNASGTPYWSSNFASELSPAPPVPRLRQNSSTTASNGNVASSIHSSSTDDSSKFSLQSSANNSRKGSWQQMQQPPLPSPPINNPLPTGAAIAGPVPTSSVSSPPPSNTATVQRSGTTATTAMNAQVIQQRKVDPIAFGGSDALWETIAKSKTADSTIEKMIR